MRLQIALWLCLVLLPICGAWGVPALAFDSGKPVAYVQIVEGRAAVATSEGLRGLESMSKVFLDDLLVVEEAGRVQLVFHDGGFLVVSGPAMVKTSDFSHEWGDESPAVNHARFEIGLGVVRVETGRILEKNRQGLAAATPRGEVQLQGHVVGFELKEPEAASEMTAILDKIAGELDEKEASEPALGKELVDLFSRVMAGDGAELRAAYLSGRASDPLVLRFKNGGEREIQYMEGVQIDADVKDLPAAQAYEAWALIRRDKEAEIPRVYRIMLGDDWGESGGDGGDGCGC